MTITRLGAAGYALGRVVAAAVMVIAVVLAGAECLNLSFTACVVILGCGLIAAIFMHELGHFGCARLLSVPVRGFYIGGPPAVVSFRLGRVTVGLGRRLRGRVEHALSPAAWRNVAITLAGPVVNLLLAAGSLLYGGHAGVALALLWGGMGVSNLVPFRTATGRFSDGANLFRDRHPEAIPAVVRALADAEGWFRRPDTADRLLAAYRSGVVDDSRGMVAALGCLLAEAERIDDLLEVHDGLRLPDGTPTASRLHAIHGVEWAVLTVPGLPREVADVAATRVEWVLRHDREHRLATSHTLALARLRQGRPIEVEPLCAEALASELGPEERAQVLATVAMARLEMHRPIGTMVDEALALAPDASIVREVAGRVTG
jgi:hypothetical protein